MANTKRPLTRRNLLLAGLGLAAAPLRASSVLPLDFAQLSRAARHVIAGRVVSVEPERDPASGYIYSRVTLRVFQAEPSQLAGREYSFRMIGGEMGGQRLHIADFPEFGAGDSVVLFLSGQTSTVFGPTVGLWQGVFFADGDRETALVRDSSRRAVLAVREGKLIRGPAGTGSAALSAPGASSRGVTVRGFFEEVRRLRALPPER